MRSGLARWKVRCNRAGWQHDLAHLPQTLAERARRGGCRSPGGGKVTRSLSSLAGMPLEELYIDQVDMDSIEPLRGMRLGKLTIRDSRVSDLRPLAGMPLTNLVLSGCKNVEELSPLKGLPLQWLTLDGAVVQDLLIRGA